jgi:hypothetical protein
VSDRDLKPENTVRPCTCRALILPGAPPCPEHVGYSDGRTWWTRCGDSDATGGPYYVGREIAVGIVRGEPR